MEFMLNNAILLALRFLL